MELLSVSGLNKKYLSTNTKALTDVSFSLSSGEIHALVGENGAGKTTLAKIICGLEKPDSGSMFIKGREVFLSSYRNAQDAGVSLVPQFSMLAPCLSVADNIALGHEPLLGGFIYNKQNAKSNCEMLNEQYGFNLEPSAIVETLPLSKQRELEIMRAVARGGDIIIMDESTSILGESEAIRLYDLLYKLKASGKGIIFISHRAKEIINIADRITVMHDSKVVETINTKMLTLSELEKKISVRKTNAIKKSTVNNNAEPKLEIIPHITVNAGEIAVIISPGGSGLDVLEDSLIGFNNVYDILIKGKKITGYSFKELQSIITYIPANREARGLCLGNSAASNIISKKLFSYTFFEYAKSFKPFQDAKKMFESFGIKYWQKKPVDFLSGGKRQRLVLSRELERQSEIIIASQPAQGLDAEGRVELFNRLIAMRNSGAAILILTSDNDDVTDISDSNYILTRDRLIQSA